MAKRVKNRTPAWILREHIGLNVLQMAQQTGISRPTVYKLETGEGCGSTTWRKIRARWGLELWQTGLTADDFIAGAVVEALESQRRIGA